ncbi:vegetative incompatibility protein HET-E-1 [Colletotrichum spaethianum]|uniref:Vegetative incompatibility protein HET-E-1 n=1 Tax=Colletotrichum spaethianum TaxID=700344 RepID=A0AA37LCJ4_9PEZI|nr:vegetative incompatibility protein HET-E-1 [Colletotrichum spaethianum]GKT45992.1 vegetative incompatibility protein HET-E-1 [Colletotrichum spaethianum]
MSTGERATSQRNPDPRSEFHGQGISHSGSGNLNIGRDLNIISHDRSEQDTKFLADLRSTDPRDDKTRIERTKGGLLRDSYYWILEHADFQQWQKSDQSRLLWIKGDPGKGKTMLLCGIIDELEKQPADTRILSYFFCQATDLRLNNATAVLRGLIYMLLDQQTCLIERLRKKYDHAGRQLFEDVNSWDVLSKMLISILQDPCLQDTDIYLLIDALDECETNLDQLLHLIVQISSSSRSKLIVSSRNWPNIENALADATQKIRLSLELNQQSISAAVGRYIQYKVNQLVRWKHYDDKTRNTVLQHLVSNANDTFLWVALMAYARMMDRIFKYNSVDADLCRQVLSRVSVVYRPLSLVELTSLIEPPEDFPNDVESLQTIIGLCGSLLTLREGCIYFVHQSAKDFLMKKESNRIYPHGIFEENRTIVARSLQVMSTTLRRDIYQLRAPGYSVNQVKPPNPDPLAPVRYSCFYWVHHLTDSNSTAQKRDQNLQDRGPVYLFLTEHYLHLLEALSLLGNISEGVLQFAKLAHLAQLAWDGLRFIRTHRASIENSPLQTYASALIFSPMQSIIRNMFCGEEPKWIVSMPAMEDEWDLCLQTLEGHSQGVNSVAFLRNGTQIASASSDSTIKVWDSTTGQCLQTLKGRSSAVNSVAFSGDGTQLASASVDKTIKVWDIATGQCFQTLMGHSQVVNSAEFSGNRMLLASTSVDKTVKVWDIATGQCLQTLRGHSSVVNSVAFSGDGTQIASASSDKTIKVWDSVTGHCIQTLEGHSQVVGSVAFSSDSVLLASASADETVKVWDSATGQCLQTLNGHNDMVWSVAFSGNGTLLASASADTTVKVWDSATGQCLQTLRGHRSNVWSVAFLDDSTLLASASADETIKVWDSVTGQCLHTLEGHSDSVRLMAFSCDSTLLASASYDETIKIWDTKTGWCLQNFNVDPGLKYIYISEDGRQLHTDMGAVDLETVTSISAATHPPVATAIEKRRLYDYGFCTNVWITRHSENLLWLPPEYRPGISIVVGPAVAIGCESGRVLLFRFSDSEIIV